MRLEAWRATLDKVTKVATTTQIVVVAEQRTRRSVMMRLRITTVEAVADRLLFTHREARLISSSGSYLLKGSRSVRSFFSSTSSPIATINFCT